MKNLFENIKNIAIIGLSPDPNKDSHIVGKYLKNVGFNIVPIYPKEDFILGQRVFRSLQDTTGVDCVVVFRKSSACEEIAKEIVKMNNSGHKIKIVWLQLGIKNENAKKILKDIEFVENKCIKIELERENYGI